MGDIPWWVWIVGFIGVCWILSMIPIWVYVTLGCLLAAGFLIWLLGVCGVYDAIGEWWGRKSVDERIRFRKGCWCVLLGASVLWLCDLFPIVVGIPVAVLVALAFATRWSRLRRERRQAAAVRDIDEETVA